VCTQAEEGSLQVKHRAHVADVLRKEVRKPPSERLYIFVQTNCTVRLFEGRKQVTVFRRHVPRMKAILFSFECSLIFVTLYTISYLVFLYQRETANDWSFDPYQQSGKAIVFMAVCQVCLYLNELYDRKIVRGQRELAIRLLQAVGVACILLSLIYVFWRSICISQSVFLISVPTIIVLLFLWRQLYAKILKSEALVERIVILGNAVPVERILDEFEGGKDLGFEIEAVVTEGNDQTEHTHNPPATKEVISLEEFPQRAEALDVDRIIVAIEDRRGKMPFRSLLNCRFKGIQVEEAASFYETLTGKIVLDRLRPSWFIFSEGFRINKLVLRLKRATDIILAGLLLIASSPIILLTAFLIKLDSKGPIIYKQDRVGQGWNDYILYKFRSMVEDAESCGVVWAEKDDPRVTRVGRLIRKYRIDELPQLFNVLKGDMSFVGPRPERRFFVEGLAKEIPYYPYRLFVKPGITGWAQVKFHYGASKNETMEKLQYDLHYIKHMSLLFDLSIIFDTIRVVLSGKGAR